tara:strand:+ start:77 stop:358 length:282 start_codon:yes stop_codon:yes gene_type:complete
MSFVNKLNDTYKLINKLDDFISRDTSNVLIKKQLLSISEDLASYKDVNEKFTKIDNHEMKDKIHDILNRINEIEINVRNKLKITERYNSYLNS